MTNCNILLPGMFSVLFIVCISCTRAVVDTGTGAFHPVSVEKDLTTYDLESIRGFVAQQVEYRIKEKPKDILMISNDWWMIEGYYNAGEVSSAANDDYWFKLNEDHTYMLGNGSEITEKGLCHFEESKGELLMLPNDESKQPKIWDIQFAGDQFVLFGTRTYGVNNGMQIKFILRAGSPLSS